MRTRSYSQEARYCRDLATELEDGPQRPFLLSVSEAFEDLARRNPQPEWVVGPLGELLTLERLPRASTTRWTPRRKAEVVAAVAGGLLTVDEACERYAISLEELTGWQRAVNQSGMAGLRVTRTQQYRSYEQRHPG